MAVPSWCSWPAAGLILALAACSGNPRPPAEPPAQTVSELEPPQPVVADPAPPPPPPPPPRAIESRTLPPEVVIEPVETEQEEQPTLAEAAQRERQRRRTASQPTVVITDANLAEHAVGELTFIEDEAPAAGPEGTESAIGGDDPNEQYWRERVREIRQRWADSAARVPELEDRVTELRQRFYEADDAYYRDTRIKPAWDRTIDLISQTRAEAEAHQQQLQSVLEEGRLAGALPGWLREGIELEPVPEKPVSKAHEPGEPVIVEPVEGGVP